MTTLIDRIRAHVAKLPAEAKNACGGCGNADPRKVCIGCRHPFGPEDTPADALLREVAALEPIGCVTYADSLKLSDMFPADIYSVDMFDEGDIYLYTLTGATHD